MHHPVSFDPFCCLPFVENKGFLQTYAFTGLGRVDRPVSSSGLPETSPGHTIRPGAVSVLAVSWAVEIPLLLPICCYLCLNKVTTTISILKFIKKNMHIEYLRRKLYTWKIPWIVFVDVDLLDELDRERFVVNLSSEVKPY